MSRSQRLAAPFGIRELVFGRLRWFNLHYADRATPLRGGACEGNALEKPVIQALLLPVQQDLVARLVLLVEWMATRYLASSSAHHMLHQRSRLLPWVVAVWVSWQM